MPPSLPLKVQAGTSQIAFGQNGPVLSLGLTLQIQVNDLIEALLAYQTHYERSKVKEEPPPPATRVEPPAQPITSAAPPGLSAQKTAPGSDEIPKASDNPPQSATLRVSNLRERGENKMSDYHQKAKWAPSLGYVPDANDEVHKLSVKQFVAEDEEAAKPLPFMPTCSPPPPPDDGPVEAEAVVEGRPSDASGANCKQQ